LLKGYTESGEVVEGLRKEERFLKGLGRGKSAVLKGYLKRGEVAEGLN
jgi:hypothetical protein